MIAISLISVTLLLILAAIAIYLSVNNLLLWKEIEVDTVRAKVFLDKSFLKANFKLTLAACFINRFSLLVFNLAGRLITHFQLKIAAASDNLS